MKEINLKMVGDTVEIPTKIKNMRWNILSIREVIGFAPINDERDVFVFLLGDDHLAYKAKSFKQNAIYKLNIEFHNTTEEISGYYKCSIDGNTIQLKKVSATRTYEYVIKKEYERLKHILEFYEANEKA